MNPLPAGAVDAHVHVWQTAPGRYRWLSRAPGALCRSFGADEAGAALAEVGAERAVLVQAEDSEADTEDMLAVAARHPWVAGVVGWVQLDDPGRTADQLDRYGDRLVGVRHLVHEDPRPGFLGLPTVHRSLELVAERGLAVDVPDAWPGFLDQVGPLADAHPDLTVVLDHLGKPPHGAVGRAAWASELAQVAGRPNVVAKVSGLQGPPVVVANLRPVLDTAVEHFGPSRLAYGSDWPMTEPDGAGRSLREAVREWAAELSPTEQHHLFRGTAERAYRLDGPAAVQPNPAPSSDEPQPGGTPWPA